MVKTNIQQIKVVKRINSPLKDIYFPNHCMTLRKIRVMLQWKRDREREDEREGERETEREDCTTCTNISRVFHFPNVTCVPGIGLISTPLGIRPIHVSKFKGIFMV